MASEITSTSTLISQPTISVSKPIELEAVVENVDSAVSEAIKPRADIKIDTESVMTKEEVSNAVQSLNDMMKALDRNINFSTDPGTGKDVVKVTDSNTGKVIRQLPGDETLKFIRNLNNMVGVLFDKKT